LSTGHKETFWGVGPETFPKLFFPMLAWDTLVSMGDHCKNGGWLFMNFKFGGWPMTPTVVQPLVESTFQNCFYFFP